MARESGWREPSAERARWLLRVVGEWRLLPIEPIGNDDILLGADSSIRQLDKGGQASNRPGSLAARGPTLLPPRQGGSKNMNSEAGVYTEEALTKEQLDRIERLQTDYNAIDQYIRRELAAERASSFTSLLRAYSR